MVRGIASSAVFALAIAGSATAYSDVSIERPANRFAAELLDSHNAERESFGAPPLRWSPRLANEAQRWARQLAREGRMRHASSQERKGAGENLWTGQAGTYSAQFIVNAFVQESRHFRAGIFPHISNTGNWRDVGHYTQVVWPATRELGCAVARNETDDFLVCRYWPAGNTYGVEIGKLR